MINAKVTINGVDILGNYNTKTNLFLFNKPLKSYLYFGWSVKEEVVGITTNAIKETKGYKDFMYGWYVDWIKNEPVITDFAGFPHELKLLKKKETYFRLERLSDMEVNINLHEKETGRLITKICRIDQDGITKYSYAEPDKDVYDIPDGMFNDLGIIKDNK